VRTTLLSWIKNLVTKYKIDGLRIDTVPEVPKTFWKQFSTAAGVYTVG
jgi:alpha-amylase